jgi:putative phosphonate catabolism associated alcohol dehydrogenase
MIRTSVFDGPGKPLRFECFAAPKLRPGEARVRISLCTVCGSDLHTFAGRRPGPTPCVLGHEPVGIIEEMNGELRDVAGEAVRPGERVVWSVAVSCAECFFCTHGLPQKCERLRKYGHEAHTPGTGSLGGLSTHCQLLRGTAIVKVPRDLPDAVAAPAGCATATVMAAWRALGLNEDGRGKPGRSLGLGERPGLPRPSVVVVLGLGMLGLTACAVATTAGHTVIACDVSDSRLSLARQFGAIHMAKPAELVELAKTLTAGRGADCVLENSGSQAAAALSLEVLRVGGTAVWVGAVSPVTPTSVDPETVVRRCLTITGVHNYAPSDLADAVNFLAANHARFPFSELVARTFPLEAVDAAFQFAEAEKPVRVVIACCDTPPL